MISLFVLIFASVAEAKSYPEEMKLYVPVPRSELKIDVPEVKSLEPATIELGASSWEPDNFLRQNYLRQTGQFTGDIPQFSLNYGMPVLFFSHRQSLRLKFGISYSALNRNDIGTFRKAPVAQRFSLYSGRAGVEYGAPVLAGFVQPYAGFALLPTLGLSSQSEIEDSVSALGLPMEATGGILFRSKWEVLGFTNLTFGLGGQYIFGKLEDSDLKGFGAQGFVRVGL